MDAKQADTVHTKVELTSFLKKYENNPMLQLTIINYTNFSIQV